MGKESERKAHVVLSHDSPRLVLPKAVISVLVTLIEELPELPSETRVELRNALAALRRAYRLPAVASEAAVHADLEDSDDGI